MKRIGTQTRKQALAIAASLLALAASGAAAQDNGSNLPPGMIARQGNAQVSLQDIDAYAQKIPEKDRAGFFDSPKRIQGVIMNLLLQRQLAAEARTARLDADPLVTLEIQQATEEALARADLEHFRQGLKLPDFTNLAQEYYASHKDEFVTHGVVNVKHVLVSTKDRSEAEAKARIGEVEAAAKAHPDQFDALVEKYSDDPSKDKNHGLIEDGASSKMAPPFAQAAAALKKPGEISPITKTQFGFHVLKLVERKPDTQKTFAEVRTDLIEKLRKDYVEKQSADHVAQLRSISLDANPDLIASLRTRFLPPGAVLPEDADKAAAEAAAKKRAEKDPAAH